MTEPELMLIREVAAKFGVTPKSVYRWIHKGMVTPAGSESATLLHYCLTPGGAYRMFTEEVNWVYEQSKVSREL